MMMVAWVALLFD